jgi:ribonuclease G
VPWFRWKKRLDEEAPGEAALPEALEEEQSEPAAESGPADGSEPGEESEAKPRRRRGTRGGRGRKKTTGQAEPGEATAEVEARPPAEEKKPTRQRRERQRRPATPRRPALPSVKKEILVSVDVGERRVAVLEDGKPAEVYLERRGRRSIAGDVFKGVVDNVLPGMEASFVDIGLEKNGFLYVDEIVVPELEGKRGSRRIQDLVQRGQEVLVQAVKDPMGTKGARLTTEISLPGRFLVYVPYGEGIGVSRRLEDAERERLKAICKELELPEGGIIVRTAAEGASQEELEGDVEHLRNLWTTIRARAEKTKPPAHVYQEAELPLRIVRDLFIRDFERVVVDHERTHRRIVGYLRRTSPELAARVELYTDEEPLMERSGVEQAVRSTLSRRVDLPSGGYLIFDYAEAFTVIDVNTGRFVGARGKASGARLEDTITKNNLEAVVEVVRQLRLRDIGGIIVIDFIDMANPKNRAMVEEALQAELERDRTKTYVVEISPLGLVEMTRQNVTDGPREILTRACPICAGDGIVVSDETHAIDVERSLRRLVAGSAEEAFLVELNAHVGAVLAGSGASRLAEFEEETGKRFALALREDVAHEHVALLAQGRWDEIEQKGLPLAVGQELMVKLEPGDGEDAIGQVDGYSISIAGAVGKIGKRMKIRVVRTTPAGAYAVLTSARRPEPPIVAEDLAEAVEEKPKPRRSRARKPAREVAVAEPAEAPEEPAGPGVEAKVEGGPEAPPKKRTRRGSRGGRGRRKPAAAEAHAAQPEEELEKKPAEGETAEEAAVDATPAAAESEAGGEAAPKKRTRRGSRGGRGRKRKPAGEELSPNGSAPAEEATAAVTEVLAEHGAVETTAAEPKAAEPPRKRTRRGSRGGRGRRPKAPAADGAVDGGESEDAGTPGETAAVAPEDGG